MANGVTLMQLITLEDMGVIYGWRGHSAFFNTQQYGFPQPVETKNGIDYYHKHEVDLWDKERPLKPDSPETSYPIHIVK